MFPVSSCHRSARVTDDHPSIHPFHPQFLLLSLERGLQVRSEISTPPGDWLLGHMCGAVTYALEHPEYQRGLLVLTPRVVQKSYGKEKR